MNKPFLSAATVLQVLMLSVAAWCIFNLPAMIRTLSVVLAVGFSLALFKLNSGTSCEINKAKSADRSALNERHQSFLISLIGRYG